MPPPVWDGRWRLTAVLTDEQILERLLALNLERAVIGYAARVCSISN